MAAEWIRPSGVIFDFDGVVVDSVSMHLQAWRLAARELFGVELTEPDMQPLMGKATRAIAEIICDKFKRSLVAELMKLKSTHVIALRDRIPLRLGSKEAMMALVAARIPVGIASNAPRDFVRGVAQHHQLPVNVVLGVEDAQRPKPAPDLFLRCAQLLEIPVTEHVRTIVFEDSTHGLEAAVLAGMMPIGVTSMHNAEILTAAGAKLVTLDFRELIAAITHAS